ncbi:GNAT family N-acetyltransferase [Ethanoligenens harbinense]|uniref:GCN5-related N-acetyltransferase n=1 Tax=Ethanoligenens harbinense (strain DSM 18485 / JCM 12961 / CGMCC 1.5033 / YUAN-3) TaxID=663278 RepID=E6U7R0_ETHHY|nr:GNAT family N-acetyltransferase [Ethanoligenens harbinense]ADU28183.1 GCN5-related N-acetyltransferase [Ethanoligenens harbinense YUAN-3]AVQ97185.1 N-acetyltransferase [Ethanoligenens harbinense YUAN-3]AYF39848.1 N-acetyltransferase [Ethanoligenens harbinense]AYF42680.1 N-acetyltransferase [Ethanoligenens harbinense]QCN93429.1 GNAT family N-acetyltransferase [Ethanoligenens harbinense]
MHIREANENDLYALLRLYTQLHDNPMPVPDDALRQLWQRMLRMDGQHALLGEEDGEIVSSCVLTVIPNLTHGQRPYALVENVITDGAHRGKGCATAVLHAAEDIAVREGCCKIMLLTASKLESTLRFYERAGYNRHDKTAFIRWLPE